MIAQLSMWGAALVTCVVIWKASKRMERYIQDMRDRADAIERQEERVITRLEETDTIAEAEVEAVLSAKVRAEAAASRAASWAEKAEESARKTEVRT